GLLFAHRQLNALRRNAELWRAFEVVTERLHLAAFDERLRAALGILRERCRAPLLCALEFAADGCRVNGEPELIDFHRLAQIRGRCRDAVFTHLNLRIAEW